MQQSLEEMELSSPLLLAQQHTHSRLEDSIVHPQVDSVLITPICPHTLSSRPLVLPGNSIIDMKLALDNKPKISAVHLTMDGQEGMEITAGQVINISTSNYYVNFVKSSKRNYFQVLGLS